MRSRIILLAVVVVVGCGPRPRHWSGEWEVPAPPDYAHLKYWAAHPDKADEADRVPDPSLRNRQDEAEADVFFVHPTTFSGRAHGWNADADDAQLKRETDETTIRHQASIFNGAGRVFAPRYRQAHLRAFYTKDERTAARALDLAYEDVRRAFQYYLDYYNAGRPIIIAAHSQGARHAVRLVKEFFDGKPLADLLVAAWIVGWPVRKDAFETIPLCATADQTGCFVSWRSFRHGYVPKRYVHGDSIACINPLLWTPEERPAPPGLNEGAVPRSFDRLWPGLVGAQVHEGLLWVRLPGGILLMRRNYHIADYNLFYVNVRKNAMQRVARFLEARGGQE